MAPKMPNSTGLGARPSNSTMRRYSARESATSRSASSEYAAPAPEGPVPAATSGDMGKMLLVLSGGDGDTAVYHAGPAGNGIDSFQLSGIFRVLNRYDILSTR